MRPSSLGGAALCVALCLSVCLSVRLSVRPVIAFGPASVTSRHLANYNDTHVLFGTHWGPHIVRPSRPHRFLFIIATFYVSVAYVSMCSVSWLSWLSCQYLPSDWLERLLWWCLYAVRRLSPQSPGRRALMTFGLLCCFVVLLCVCLLSPRTYTTCFILLWHDIACLCWKCR